VIHGIRPVLLMRVFAVASLFLVSVAAPASAGQKERDDLAGPPPEVVKNEGRIEAPSIPPFDLPIVEAGFHGPRELRVRGKPLIGAEVKVKGYITGIYDCAADLALANPEAMRGQIMTSIDNDPSLCGPAKFYLGDTKDTARASSIWIVDVPRAPTKSERAKLSKAQLKALPPVPRIATGEYVVVTGTWANDSPGNEHNVDGLLVFKSLEHAKPVVIVTAAATASSAPVADPDVAVVTQAPLRDYVDSEIRNNSVDHLNACNKAIAAKRYDAALAECQTATKIWPGNHRAYYAWASAHMAKNEWNEAKATMERAVNLRPDQAMYHLYYGIALYEAERNRVRDEQAQREHKKPDDVVINSSLMKLGATRDALLRAAKLDPALWRAHYYLGRVYRDLDDPKRAAAQFTQTITTHPSYRFGYIALIELYRRWDYVDQALTIALLGTTAVSNAESAELWFEAGMAFDAKHADDQAIDAFSKAIAGRPDDISAKFQRGQIYYRKGDLVNAKRDLEEVTRSSDPKVANDKPIASQLLAQITRRQR